MYHTDKLMENLITFNNLQYKKNYINYRLKRKQKMKTSTEDQLKSLLNHITSPAIYPHPPHAAFQPTYETSFAKTSR